MKIYLSGPMSGIDKYNFPAFDYAAAKLRAEGHEVFSPADNDRRYGLVGDLNQPFPPSVTVRVLLADDLEYICKEADMIAVLPGWEQSSGAKAEIATAQTLGLCVRFLGRAYWLDGKKPVRSDAGQYHTKIAP